MGMLWWLLLALWLRGRRLDKALDDFSIPAEELGTLVGNRWREEELREAKLLELQQSIESLTRWLVILTVVVGATGLVAAIAAIWAATNG